ncbi:MAG: FAD-dependent oxidoreductase [Spirochaetales bacterium]|nr:FAD-dependent oxidoreductase [Spirochaetales bacterium]
MEKTQRIVIVGGSAAGPKAAAKARRLDQNAEIIILQKEKDLSMASCGYPYYIGGTFDNRNMLLSTPTGVIRDPKFYLNAKGIDARICTEVLRIDRTSKKLEFRNTETDETGILEYSKLILATGSVSKLPPVRGIDLEGVTTLRSMDDAEYLRKIRDEKKIKKAVVIGGGLIGLETCEALHLAGIEITVVELLPQILTFLDWEMAMLSENHIKSKNANVITGNGVAEFIGDENNKLKAVKLSNGIELDCELAVIAIGVRPNGKLAKDAGLEIGVTGGIVVNEYMQTSDPSIYAAGDCVELTNSVTGRKVFAPLGDLANLEGRVAGENAAIGNAVTFQGTLQTGICKIFDFKAGFTGVTERLAKELNMDTVSVINASPDKPAFMGGKLLVTKLIADRASGKILGAQCVGPGDVNRQIATWAVAIKGKLTVEDMVDADLPYAPPFSLAIDHSITTAHLLQNKMKGRLKGISAKEVKTKADNKENVYILDVRGSDEYEQMRLGIGETLIPLGGLRKRLEELPADRNTEIICYCKISLRGYEAALIIENAGYTNVKVMEGGIMAWPYTREK